MISMFRGKKTSIFYIGLLGLGFGLYYLVQVIFQIVALGSLYLSSHLTSSLLQLLTSSVIAFLPSVFGAVFFIVIGLYTMSKGVEAETHPSP